MFCLYLAMKMSFPSHLWFCSDVWKVSGKCKAALEWSASKRSTQRQAIQFLWGERWSPIWQQRQAWRSTQLKIKSSWAPSQLKLFELWPCLKLTCPRVSSHITALYEAGIRYLAAQTAVSSSASWLTKLARLFSWRFGINSKSLFSQSEYTI